MKFILHCNTLNTGWAFLTLRYEEVQIKMKASYWNDCFNDLLGAAIRTLQGRNYRGEECSFAHESGEHILHWTRRDDYIYLNLWKFDAFYMRPLREIQEKGQCIFKAKISSTDFIKQVHWLIHRLRFIYGEEEYAQQWGYPFPTERYEAISRWVAYLKRQERRLSA